MLENVKLLATISRAEFLLPNLGSLIMGLAWGAAPPLNLTSLLISIAFSFTIINLSSAIGAQANTLSDYELDQKDPRKQQLVEATQAIGQKRLKTILAVEFVFALILVTLFTWMQQNPALLIMWIVGISLGYCYSMPPLRLKSRSWIAPISLMIVLAILPVLFAYYTFTSQLNPYFLIALTGLTLTVYAVITPTEIRDYFGDKAMNIQTFTVRIGLTKASLLGIVLLGTGAALTTTGYLLQFLSQNKPLLSLILLFIPAAAFFVLAKFNQLYTLSKKLSSDSDSNPIAQQIVDSSAHNPQWIMIVTQTYSAISIIMMLSKFI